MKRRRQQFFRSPHNDSGATLILVLVIVTVIGLVGAALLTFSDTSIRTTVALRDQASAAYAADGAAQVAISKLQQTGNCGVGTGVALGTPGNEFYKPPASSTSGPLNAYVRCTPDKDNGNGGSATSANTSPGTALLALDSKLAEDGIYANINAGAMKIDGAIFSNSRINATSGIDNIWQPPVSDPNRTTYNIARGACLPNAAAITTVSSSYGTTICDYGTKPDPPKPDPRGDDPGTLQPHGASYDAPPPPSGLGSISDCSGADTLQIVTPGLFTDAAALNNLTGCANKRPDKLGVVWFKPGKYYFDFTAANTTWSPPALFIIAGTPTPPLNLTTTNPTVDQMPTACIAPGDTDANPGTGAEFVFGGNSRLSVNTSANPGAQFTICASPTVAGTGAGPGGGPPIAIYGLKDPLPSDGGLPVAAQTTCYADSHNCSLISTGNSPKSALTIQGTMYAPKAFIDVVLNNNSKKVFYWGLIAWAISFTGTGSADVTNALVGVPDPAANPTPAVNFMYLDVWVCPASVMECPHSGSPQLRAKVQVTGSTVKVLSWSVQR